MPNFLLIPNSRGGQMPHLAPLSGRPCLRGFPKNTLLFSRVFYFECKKEEFYSFHCLFVSEEFVKGLIFYIIILDSFVNMFFDYLTARPPDRIAASSGGTICIPTTFGHKGIRFQ